VNEEWVKARDRHFSLDAQLKDAERLLKWVPHARELRMHQLLWATLGRSMPWWGLKPCLFTGTRRRSSWSTRRRRRRPWRDGRKCR
jgi:hypothetical protein